MSDTPRCEPPEGLRDRDGWHWLESIPSGHQYLGQWVSSERHWKVGVRVFASVTTNLNGIPYRYLCSVPSPAEIAALVNLARQHAEAVRMYSSVRDESEQWDAALLPFKGVAHG